MKGKGSQRRLSPLSAGGGGGCGLGFFGPRWWRDAVYFIASEGRPIEENHGVRFSTQKAQTRTQQLQTGKNECRDCRGRRRGRSVSETRGCEISRRTRVMADGGEGRQRGGSQCSTPQRCSYSAARKR